MVIYSVSGLSASGCEHYHHKNGGSQCIQIEVSVATELQLVVTTIFTWQFWRKEILLEWLLWGHKTCHVVVQLVQLARSGSCSKNCGLPPPQSSLCRHMLLGLHGWASYPVVFLYTWGVQHVTKKTMTLWAYKINFTRNACLQKGYLLSGLSHSRRCWLFTFSRARSAWVWQIWHPQQQQSTRQWHWWRKSRSGSYLKQETEPKLVISWEFNIPKQTISDYVKYKWMIVSANEASDSKGQKNDYKKGHPKLEEAPKLRAVNCRFRATL